jgi:hypothetical protein
MSKEQTSKRDPRFFRVRPRTHKLEVDERFKKALTASTKLSKRRRVDKYGRTSQTKESDTADLRRYYQLSEESSAASSTSESEASGSGSDDSDYAEPVSIELEERAMPKEVVPVGQATRRLAVVNLDWDQIKAKDIFVLLHGFRQPGGHIQSVRILPSEFGKHCLAQEALHGPAINPVHDVDPAIAQAPTSGSSDEEEGGSRSRTIYEENLRLQADEKGYNDEAVRQYQLQRLRYYFAVIECDSVTTTQHLYAECDGQEFEQSANVLDLRYIPDDVTFDLKTTHDLCDALPLPSTYKPKTEVVTTALQNTNVKLTWDEDDIDRKRALADKRPQKGKKKLDPVEEDLEAYLASASSDDDQAAPLNGGDERGTKLRSLVEGISGVEEDVYGRKQRKDLGFEIAFQSAFDTQLQRPEREKVHMNEKDREFSFQVQQPKRKSSKKQLFPDTDGESAGSDEGAAVKPGRERANNNLQSVLLPEMQQHHGLKDFQLDPEDQRFHSVYEDADFAIDPSHKAYRPTAGMRAIMQQRKQRFYHSSHHQ